MADRQPHGLITPLSGPTLLGDWLRSPEGQSPLSGIAAYRPEAANFSSAVQHTAPLPTLVFDRGPVCSINDKKLNRLVFRHQFES
jgi:hypothetical protein